jgi:hypothetical protein
MRKVALFALALTAGLSTTGSAVRADDSDKGKLAEKDVKRVVADHVSEIRSCYERFALPQKEAGGKVELEMVVGRDGTVRKDSIKVSAEGVKGKRFPACVADSVHNWEFPATEAVTLVQYPFFFLKTHARGAGPVR